MATSTSFKLFFPAFLIVCAALSVTTDAFRPLPNTGEGLEKEPPESMTYCWDSLLELRSCTGEVILFFLNGETFLGPSCCHAINYVQHRCWPAMLTSLGFTPEENDILRGYCDATSSVVTGNNSTTPPPPPPPLSTSKVHQ